MAIPDPPLTLDLVTVLGALASKPRVRIVAQLDREPGIPCAMFEGGMNKSTRSHHLNVLRDAGLVESWRDASQVLNKVRRGAVDAQFPGLLDAIIEAASHDVGGHAGASL